MPLFSSENWSRTAAASVAGVLIVAVLAFAVVGYVERSSDANLDQFMGRTTEAAAVTLPLKGRTGCEQKSPSALSLPLDDE